MNSKFELFHDTSFLATDSELAYLMSTLEDAKKEQIEKLKLQRLVIREAIQGSVKNSLVEHYSEINKHETNVFLRKLYTLIHIYVSAELKKHESAHLDLTGIISNSIYDEISPRTLYKGETYRISEFRHWALF